MKEKCRFFDIALASIAESAAAIDFIVATGYSKERFAQRVKSTLIASYKMLEKLRKLNSIFIPPPIIIGNLPK